MIRGKNAFFIVVVDVVAINVQFQHICSAHYQPRVSELTV